MPQRDERVVVDLRAIGRRVACGLVAAFALGAIGCRVVIPAPRSGPSELAPIAVRGRDFVERGPEGERRFVAWGFNYYCTNRGGYCVVLLEDLLDRDPEPIEVDFAAMRALGANSVRIFLPTSLVLASPDRADPRLHERMKIIFDAARKHGLRLVITGLSHIRADDVPDWLRSADDATMQRAEETFWRVVAREGRDENVILAYDLQNEPIVPLTDTNDFTVGCWDVVGQRYCYSHLVLRHVESVWNPHLEDFASFQARILADWALRLRRAIRSEDPAHLITVGALFPFQMRDAVDFYAVHLYPGSSLENVPDDKPVLVEEIYPLFVMTDAPSVLAHLIDASNSKLQAAGWLSFYFGAPELQLPQPQQSSEQFRASLEEYRATLARWSVGPPQQSGGYRGCRVGFEFLRGFVTAVSSNATRAGLSMGDRIVSIDGRPFDTDAALGDAIVSHAPGDRVRFVVQRSGNESAIDAECMDGHPLKDADRRIKESVADGRWSDCIRVSWEFEQISALVPPPADPAWRRMNCALALAKAENRPVGPTEMTLVYEARRRSIRKSALVPGALDEIRGDVLTTVEELRRGGYSDLADDLERRLNAATGTGGYSQ